MFSIQISVVSIQKCDTPALCITMDDGNNFLHLFFIIIVI